MAVIVCFGPGPKFKGGISNYNTSLAKAFDSDPENEVHIVSWTNQYPSIIPREFVDKSSKSDFLEGTRIQVKYLTNYNNPFTWRETAKYIASLNPDKVIFQWAISIQGLPMGSIAKWLRKNIEAEVIFDLHFVVQKEGSTVDERFTKMGIKYATTYITHVLRNWEKTYAQLKPKKNSAGNRAYKEDEVQLIFKIKSLLEDKKYTSAGVKRVLSDENESAAPTQGVSTDVKKDLTEMKVFLTQLLEKL